MDPTILTEVLAFLGGSMASGFTWDFISREGKVILDSFKQRFVSKGYFTDDSSAEKFFQDISKKESYNTDEPLEDARLRYKNRFGQRDSKEFVKEFVEWFKENKTEFSDLVKQDGQRGRVNIKNQTARDKATITNIGIQNNNK